MARRTGKHRQVDQSYVMVTVRTGTPNELVEWKQCTPGIAREKARAAIATCRKWARVYNLALEAECSRVQEEVGDCNLAKVAIGGMLRWELRDDHTGFTIAIEIEREK